MRDYESEFEMVGRLKIADQTRETHIKLRIIDDYESYIHAIDQNYEYEDGIFYGYIYKTKNPQTSLVFSSQNGNGCDLKHEITEDRGNNCFIPTKGHCFVKCNHFITGEDFKQQHFENIGNEKRRSNILNKARIQAFCRANNTNLTYYDGTKGFPRPVTDRKNALFSYNNHFCLI